MARSLTIRPIELPYDKNLKTLQTSLLQHGYVRGPGAKMVFTPQPNATGRYKTGLDKDAQYIKKLPKEAQDAELALIDTLTKELIEVYGVSIDLSPNSKIWNPYGSGDELKIQPVPLGNDVVIIDDSTPMGLLTYAWIRVDSRIAQSMESFHRRECQECRYYIQNLEAEQRVAYSKKKEINTAIRKFEELSPTRKKELAAIMSLPVTEYTTEETVYNLMDTKLRESEFNKGDYAGRSVLGVFNELIALKPEHISVKNLINQAIRYNIYRDVNGSIEEGTIAIATNKDALVLDLLDEKNQAKRLALEIKVKHKKEALSQ